MPQKCFTVLMILFFIYHYFSYNDNVSLAQVGLIMLWYLLFNLLYKADKDYLNSFWSLINCYSIVLFALFIAFPIEYGIEMSLWELSLLAVLLLFSGFKFTFFIK